MEIPLGEWRIRPWRRGDEPSLVRYANNARVSAFLRDAFPHPYTPADARFWIDSCLEQERPTHFAIASATEVIGSVGLTVLPDIFHRSAEIGYWLGEPFWGRGIATRALSALSAWAFEELELLRLQAGVFANNPASARVLEKAGYHLEARLVRAVVKRSEVLDLLLFARLKA
ncbi:MAG TPA: GNAT family N-acetyltransferase [Thermoanaerobaculia bacterium]|nr:GNAT family N-acetyltransferase [Thermoanaerobaculia bacterium]